LGGSSPSAIFAADEIRADLAAPKEKAVAPNPDAPDQEKLRKLVIGFYLICGVAVVGGLLVLVIIWQGIRLRRMIRRPLPRAARGDELWFLKRGIDASTAAPPQNSAGSPDSENTDPSQT
jgi:hypothetical protein